MQYFPSKSFRPGVYDTKEKCELGECRWRNPLNLPVEITGISEEECGKLRQCTQDCPQCESQSFELGVDRSVCIASSALNKTACFQIGNSTWLDSNDCRIIGLSEAQCKAKGYAFYRCESLTREECGRSEAQDILRCFYNPWAACRTEEECLASGSCDDWDIVRSDGNLC